MKCIKCGAELAEVGSFCPHCGTAKDQGTAVLVPTEQDTTEPLAQEEAQQKGSEEPRETQPNGPPPQGAVPLKNPAALKKRHIIAIIIAAVIILAGSVTGYAVYSNTGERLARKQLSLGDKFLTEMKYDEAIVAFNKVIGVDPKNEAAYINLASAYIGKTDSEKAVEMLHQGLKQLPSSDAIKAKLVELQLKLGSGFPK